MSGPLKSTPEFPPQELRLHRLERLHKARQVRWRHRFKRLKRATLAAFAIFMIALVIATLTDGLGIEGFVLMLFTMVSAFVLLALFPRTRNLATGKISALNLRDLIDQTPMWLETQRRLLPSTTHVVVDELASRLQNVSPQLATLNENEPAAHEIRKLLGEHLPSLIKSYTNIPVALRQQPHAGSTPQEQLMDGLITVTREVEMIGSAVARGELDALAIRGRFLAARYGPPSEGGDEKIPR